MVKEFLKFLQRGNVIDLAVAVILGVAFGAIVTSLVNDIIMPLVGIIVGGVNFAALSVMVGEAEIKYGNFLQALVNFIIVALVLFLVIRAYNNMRARFEKPVAPGAPPVPADIALLTEIRDLLRERPGPIR
jgi:large conductance mechanosensitive channel